MRELALGLLLFLIAAASPTPRRMSEIEGARPAGAVRGSLLPSLLAIQESPPAVGEIGRVKSKIGTAIVERGTNSIAASIGQELMPGDWLVTGNDGRMSLTFVDDTRFVVGPGSRIALKKFEYDPTTQKGSFIAKVERGSIAVVSGRIAKSGRDGEQIETPDSVLDVNGTRFIVVVKK